MSHVDGNYRRLGTAILPDDAGQRIDAYLATRFPFLSRAGWQDRLRLGELLVEGRVVRSSYKLKAGESLTMFHPHEDEPEVDGNIKVLYEEAGVMAAYKPGDLPMHENGPYRKNTFANLLSKLVGPQWSAVHRLDRETSGIVLCAATQDLRQKLATDLFEKRVLKEYLAIGKGEAKDNSWLVDGPIGNLVESAIRIKKWVDPEGLPAQTDFHVEARAPGHVLLRAMPRTGRTNQIRIHAAYSGLPLVGDKLYHPDEAVFLDYFEHGNTLDVQRRAGFPRHCLHAAALTFKHPALKKECHVRSDLPQDMSDLWTRLIAGEPSFVLPVASSSGVQLVEGQLERAEQPVRRNVARMVESLNDFA